MYLHNLYTPLRYRWYRSLKHQLHSLVLYAFGGIQFHLLDIPPPIYQLPTYHSKTLNI